MGKFKKAIAGGVTGAAAALAGGFSFTGAPTQEEIGQLIGLVVGGFVVGFIGVYAAPANSGS